MSIVPVSRTPHNAGSPFDALRQTRPDGSHFWSARDLCPLMGYGRWERFADTIDRAKIAARNSGMDVPRVFRAAAKNLPSANGRPGEDVHLSREAAYLVAMNGDPRKQEIADAQAYFVVRTLQAEQAAESMPFQIPQTYAAALELAALQARELESAALALEAARPAVEFHDAFVTADGLYKIGDVAKVLALPGMGQNKLFQFLRVQGVLIRSGESRNSPYQRHVEAGRFVIKVTTYPRGEDLFGTSKTTYATPKGLAYIADLVRTYGPTA